MSEKYQNKYRIKSARLPDWDYASNAAYFITICTKNREHYFGDIHSEKMQLSGIGKIAEKYWSEIPNHFPFVELGEFVVMPNHVHGIIIINKKNTIVETPKLGVSTTNPKLGVSTTGVSTTNASEKWKPGILGVIINQYKRICTITARKNNPDFEWQSRYHDHIIRNDKSFQNISRYIAENPLNWPADKFYDNRTDDRSGRL